MVLLPSSDRREIFLSPNWGLIGRHLFFPPTHSACIGLKHAGARPGAQSKKFWRHLGLVGNVGLGIRILSVTIGEFGGTTLTAVRAFYKIGRDLFVIIFSLFSQAQRLEFVCVAQPLFLQHDCLSINK